MSKMAAIDYAVRRQVLEDGKNPVLNYKEVMGPDQGGGAGTFINYNVQELPIFLYNVSNRLKLDVPSLNFAWSNLDVQQVLTMNVRALELYIFAQTD
jgi:hypothetical protein